jgi:3-methyl-2-oxobutanoate hydroxymethyltransferase
MSETSGPVTAPAIAARKRARGAAPIAMLTAYDTPFARIADAAGVDIILVGDSVANNVLGLERTLEIGMAEMLHHVAAVARARPRALVVADLPWMSYHLTPEDAALNAAALIRAGAQAVKLEGGQARLGAIGAIVDAEIPVMGHLGLTPQSIHAMGGLRVQARDAASARVLEQDAKAIAAQGCFAVVLEGVPDLVARRVTEAIDVPTIGIGAGPDCDGQVLVLHDVLGLGGPPPRFARQYVDLRAIATEAIGSYVRDVRAGDFPGPEESLPASPALAEALGEDV